MAKPDYITVPLEPEIAFEVINDIGKGPAGFWLEQMPTAGPKEIVFEFVVESAHQPVSLHLRPDGTWRLVAPVLRVNPKE